MRKDFTGADYWSAVLNASLCKFFILQVLAQRHVHGYEIATLVSELTSGFCVPSQGTVYPVLREFEQCGCVTCERVRVGGRVRKVYSITDKGLEAYSAGREVWQQGLCCVTQAVGTTDVGVVVDKLPEDAAK